MHSLRFFAVVLAAAIISGEATAQVRPTTQVTTTGNNNTALGIMYGGTINIGLSQTQLIEVLKASGVEQRKFLSKIAAQMNAASPQASGKIENSEFSTTIVAGFLATVEGKNVPQSDWPRVFNQLASRFLELGERIAATPATSEKIKTLVAQAEAARKAGNLPAADKILEDAQEQTIADAMKLQEQAGLLKSQAANLVASRATLAFTSLEYKKGAVLLEKAFELSADDGSSKAFWWLVEASDAWITLGNTQKAMALLTKARAAVETKLDADPDNREWQRDLSISHNKIGDRQKAHGDLGAALKSYQAGMMIAQMLATDDPGNNERQRDLSVSYEKIGIVQQIKSDLVAAFKSYQASMTIAQKLAAADPGNSQLQRDLSLSHDNIGEVQQAQGDLGAALKSYQAGMTILQKIAEANPGNSQLQRDMSLNHEQIGDVQKAQGELDAAFKSYQAGMTIRQTLVAADPDNSRLQRDLSVSHEKFGDVQRAQGELSAALKSYQASMMIRQKLAASDPDNSRWQRDLSVSHERFGEVQQALGDLGAALKSYQTFMKIAQKLSTADPDNYQLRFDLMVSHEKIEKVQQAQRDSGSFQKTEFKAD